MLLFFLAPDFKKPFKLAVDAGRVGARDVLLQHDDNGAAHTFVLILQKKKRSLLCSNIEREAFGIILALNHFEVYVSGALLLVYTDPDPLCLLLVLEAPTGK